MKKIIRHKLSDLPQKSQTDWGRVDALSDQALVKNAQSDLDSFVADEDFWKNAKLVEPTPHKERITMHLDDDVLSWLKGMGPGYQPRINKILRSCMQSYKKRITKRKAG